ncbi:hypothetical protein NDU88_002325 [Pleurodeles waltl]|uniref:Myb/SANT-like DNA-binding domain-containing protein n=1 Tax=Pleurodeles waltl TaxID=8319 RepID=A0AAV7PBB7_PLEWA|nr:hypothetical protein NDU88_002325 [Pleurodeles waltl]
MASQQGSKAVAERKRKIKIAGRELDILTGGCCDHHEELFGRLSQRFTEADKHKIWREIQINALGLAIDEIKKRWYDLCSMAKGRVAAQLRDVQESGGGEPSNMPLSTAAEAMVETTLELEPVYGFGSLDTYTPHQPLFKGLPPRKEVVRVPRLRARCGLKKGFPPYQQLRLPPAKFKGLPPRKEVVRVPRLRARCGLKKGFPPYQQLRLPPAKFKGLPPRKEVVRVPRLRARCGLKKGFPPYQQLRLPPAKFKGLPPRKEVVRVPQLRARCGLKKGFPPYQQLRLPPAKFKGLPPRKEVVRVCGFY